MPAVVSYEIELAEIIIAKKNNQKRMSWRSDQPQTFNRAIDSTTTKNMVNSISLPEKQIMYVAIATTINAVPIGVNMLVFMITLLM